MNNPDKHGATHIIFTKYLLKLTKSIPSTAHSFKDWFLASATTMSFLQKKTRNVEKCTSLHVQ